LTAPNGRLALAGLLAGQAGEVRAAYAPWFDFEAPVEEEGWALVSGIRR
jgi:ribosomal protein L11 methyltransferase